MIRADKNYPLFLDAYLCKYANRVTSKVDFNNKLFISLLTLWKKMCDEDLIGPGSVGSTYQPDDTILFSLSYTHTQMGSDEYTYFPMLSNEKAIYPTEATFLCVMSTSKNTELAVKFLQTYLSREVQEAMIMSNTSFIYKDFSIYNKRFEFFTIKPLNTVNEQIYKNVLKHAVALSYPADLRIFITHEVMPAFMSGKITAEEAARQIQEKAEMIIME